MKGIETQPDCLEVRVLLQRSDHCPAMKGIETSAVADNENLDLVGSDHCPAMKGIETRSGDRRMSNPPLEATTAPQ